MASKNKQHKERYLKVPYHIFGIPRAKLDFGEKLLLAHFYGFGITGCYQSNKTLAEIFGVCLRTITLWVANLKAGGYILWADPRGLNRTVWVKSHPAVKLSNTLIYRGQQVLKSLIVYDSDTLAEHPMLKRGSRNPLRRGRAIHCARVAQSIATY